MPGFDPKLTIASVGSGEIILKRFEWFNALAIVRVAQLSSQAPLPSLVLRGC
jgi:hypothetical protein